jgi:hypothetical protein
VRKPDELKAAANLFLSKKNEILNLVKNFELLDDSRKREMTLYLEDFFNIISDEGRLYEVFIDNALNAK